MESNFWKWFRVIWEGWTVISVSPEGSIQIDLSIGVLFVTVNGGSRPVIATPTHRWISSHDYLVIIWKSSIIVWKSVAPVRNIIRWGPAGSQEIRGIVTESFIGVVDAREVTGSLVVAQVVGRGLCVGDVSSRSGWSNEIQYEILIIIIQWIYT